MILAATIAAAGILSAQTPKNAKFTYTEASDLTLTGKLFPDTPNPYHRVDTVVYKGFTKGENLQVRESSGLAVVFKTNSSAINVKTEYGEIQYPMNTNGIGAKGYDLYIKKGGKWLFAAAGARGNGSENQVLSLISDMDNSMKECLMYLPLYSEVKSVKIGVVEGSTIEAIPNPFQYRVGIFGSSYTHGSSTSRGGMTYPAQFTRNTGIQLLSLGCSGNSKLQSYFAKALAAADVDAYIFDSFSNPDAKMINERLFPFIETIQAAHPDIPLIFQQTIRRESRNFNLSAEKKEAAKMAMADSLMKIACKKYKNVYFITPNATTPDHLASVDGVHPTNYGYTLWAKSIEKPVLDILAKYGMVPDGGKEFIYKEASDLTLVGKLFPDTPNPYHRVDIEKYGGWTATQNFQVRCSSGIIVAFKTNAKNISILTQYGQLYSGVTTNMLAHRGYDLYIRATEKNGKFTPSHSGKWIYAGSKCPDYGKEDKPINLISNLVEGEKECLLYLPLYSEEKSIKIGVEKGATLEPLENPFRHRIGIYGSSYTHGVSCGRAGMTYPAQFSRSTGIQLLSLGMSGQCKMQPWALNALKDADVDGFIFDTFSNPSIEEINERLFPFIETMKAANPGKPLIFQRTIYRESRNFNMGSEEAEQSRIDVVDSLMAIAVKKYSDVYYIKTNATEPNHETSIDGTHPSDYGYGVWEKSIEKQVLNILKKYGIK